MDRYKPTTDVEADELLGRAQNGDEAAFGHLVENHRPELIAHCYRMLGSMHDAEDAFQEALIRAWRGLGRFDGRSSFRTWIYRIATNTSLDLIGSRKRRELPVDHSAPADPVAGHGIPLPESTWIEPFTGQGTGLDGGLSAPEARYELLESLELAFIAALQLLPPNQRAVLILRDVLGFSAREAASTLEVSEASVTSALQRARRTLDERVPERSQQETLRALGDEEVRRIIESYMDAMARGDVNAVVGMLTEDATWSMPPLATWYRGDGLRGFLETGPLSGQFRWRHLPIRTNGQIATANYTWHEDEEAWLPFCIDVLTLDGGRIREVTAFIIKTTEVDGSDFSRWPDEAGDPDRLDSVFGRLGLPARLD